MYTLCHKDFVRAGGSLVPRAATSAHVPTATPTFLSAPFARSSIIFKTAETPTRISHDAPNAQWCGTTVKDKVWHEER